jgi:hypothetical protein
MKDASAEIDAALLHDEPVLRDKVLQWIDSASDLETLAKLYRLTREGCYRIQPELGSDATCALIQRYLLECVRANVQDNDEILNRYEAAQDLHAWFCHLVELDEDHSAILKRAASAITELYLASDDEVRDCIETGFLEHALEQTALRQYFEHWSTDGRLKSAWDRALQWGKAHPDFMWSMLKKIREIQEK